METTETLLDVTALTKRFTTHHWLTGSVTKEFVAVNAVSFSVSKGEILGMLGANGAGKTTIIQMLLGTLLPSSGSISYFNKDFGKDRSAILGKIGFASAYSKLPGKLTVYENLDIFASLYGVSRHERVRRINHLLEVFLITDLRDTLMRNLSAGQTTRVILAKAFLHDPDIVLLDEPTASLDPDVAHDIRQYILEQRRERQVSMVFTSHNMAEVAEVCDRVIVVKNGSMIASGTPAMLASSIAITRLELIGCTNIGALVALMQEHNLIYSIEKNSVIIEIEELHVAGLLTIISTMGITYSNISIVKPTLEDYFIRIARD